MESNDLNPIRAFKIIQENVKQYKVEWINEEEPDELFPSTWVNKTDSEITHDLILNWIRSRVDRGSVLSYKGSFITPITALIPVPTPVVIPVTLPSPTLSLKTNNNTNNHTSSISRSRSGSISRSRYIDTQDSRRRSRSMSGGSSDSYGSTATITGDREVITRKRQKREVPAISTDVNAMIVDYEENAEEGEVIERIVEDFGNEEEEEDEEIIIVKSEPMEEKVNYISKEPVQSLRTKFQTTLRSTVPVAIPPLLSPSKPLPVVSIVPSSQSTSNPITTRPNVLSPPPSQSTTSPASNASHLPTISALTSVSTSSTSYIPSYKPNSSRPKSALEAANEYALKRQQAASLIQSDSQPMTSTSTSTSTFSLRNNSSERDPNSTFDENNELPFASSAPTSTSPNTCTYCLRVGHIQLECRTRVKDLERGTRSSRSSSSRRSERRLALHPQACEYCHRRNHTSTECRFKTSNSLSNSTFTTSPLQRCSNCQRDNHTATECRFLLSKNLQHQQSSSNLSPRTNTLEIISNNASNDPVLSLHVQAQLTPASRKHYRQMNNLCLYCGLSNHTRDNCTERLRVNEDRESLLQRGRRRVGEKTSSNSRSRVRSRSRSRTRERSRSWTREEESREYSPPPPRRGRPPSSSVVSTGIDDRWAKSGARAMKDESSYSGRDDRWAQPSIESVSGSSRRGRPLSRKNSNSNSTPISTTSTSSSQAYRNSIQRPRSRSRSPRRRDERRSHTSESPYGLGLTNDDDGALDNQSYGIASEKLAVVEPTRDPRRRN